jgi:DNA-binding response OmpR family regulator
VHYETLRRLGLEVVTAITGKIAVARAEEHGPDLILCDVMLPDMDGFDVCRELRQLDGISQTPIIFVSSVSSEKHMDRGIEAGANDYLVKPLNADDIKSLVEQYLSE